MVNALDALALGLIRAGCVVGLGFSQLLLWASIVFVWTEPYLWWPLLLSAPVGIWWFANALEDREFGW